MCNSTSNCVLSILVPCLNDRPWTTVVEELRSQAHGQPVEVLTEIDDGQLTSGVKRQLLSNRSTGEYLCFVDDDDKVDRDYVRLLLQGCGKQPDVVTFNLQMTRGGSDVGQEVWRFALGQQARPYGYMSANHLCAWRRDLARSVSWCPELGYADDQLWFQPLHASNRAVTAWHINKVLYHYQYHPQVTRNQVGKVIDKTRDYVGIGLGCFYDDDGSILVQCGHPDMTRPSIVKVRNKDGTEYETERRRLKLFHMIRLQV